MLLIAQHHFHSSNQGSEYPIERQSLQTRVRPFTINSFYTAYWFGVLRKYFTNFTSVCLLILLMISSASQVASWKDIVLESKKSNSQIRAVSSESNVPILKSCVLTLSHIWRLLIFCRCYLSKSDGHLHYITDTYCVYSISSRISLYCHYYKILDEVSNGDVLSTEIRKK